MGILTIVFVIGTLVLSWLIGYRICFIRNTVYGLDKDRRLLNQIEVLQIWVSLHQRGIKIQNQLLNENQGKIIIYGADYLGQLLLSEFESNKIKVSFFLDGFPENFDKKKLRIDIFTLDEVKDILPEDLIIVTALKDYSEIKVNIQSRFKCNVVSLSELLNLCCEPRIAIGD